MPRIVANLDDHLPRQSAWRWRPPTLIALVIATLPLTGCYLLQAASGQMEVARRSQPIERVIEGGKTAPQTTSRLVLVTEAREFAIASLGLPDGRSFREYADLGRAYPLWNVVATPEFSLRPRESCFPIAGCVAYRGYFRQEDAIRAARRWRHQGYDVAVSGVPTYSTLGHLRDPVFASMLEWRESRLVETMFHEMAHEQLYVKGDSAFNEAFATVVADAGLERWLDERGKHAELDVARASARRSRQFSSLLRSASGRLERLYRSGQAPAQMRVAKEREFGRLKFDYRRLRETWGGFAGYDAWFDRALNNAHLIAVATYENCVPGFERELAAAGSLERFYLRAAELARLPPDARRAAVCEVQP